MTHTSNDSTLRQLRPENHLYGFAVKQMLEPYLHRGCIRNQIGPECYDATAPQIVCVEFTYDQPNLPPDCFQYEALVTIDASCPFYEQVAMLRVYEATPIHGTTDVLLDETTYELNLSTLMHILPQLRSHSHLLLPLLTVSDYNEYQVSLEPDDAD